MASDQTNARALTSNNPHVRNQSNTTSEQGDLARLVRGSDPLPFHLQRSDEHRLPVSTLVSDVEIRQRGEGGRLGPYSSDPVGERDSSFRNARSDTQPSQRDTSSAQQLIPKEDQNLNRFQYYLPDSQPAKEPLTNTSLSERLSPTSQNVQDRIARFATSQQVLRDEQSPNKQSRTGDQNNRRTSEEYRNPHVPTPLVLDNARTRSGSAAVATTSKPKLYFDDYPSRPSLRRDESDRDEASRAHLPSLTRSQTFDQRAMSFRPVSSVSVPKLPARIPYGATFPTTRGLAGYGDTRSREHSIAPQGFFQHNPGNPAQVYPISRHLADFPRQMELQATSSTKFPAIPGMETRRGHLPLEWNQRIEPSVASRNTESRSREIETVSTADRTITINPQDQYDHGQLGGDMYQESQQIPSHEELSLARQQVGQLKQVLDEKQKKIDKYKAERNAARSASESFQGLLREKVRQVRDLEDTNRSLQEKLSKQSGGSMVNFSTPQPLSITVPNSARQFPFYPGIPGPNQRVYPRTMDSSSARQDQATLSGAHVPRPPAAGSGLDTQSAEVLNSSIGEADSLGPAFQLIFQKVENWAKLHAPSPGDQLRVSPLLESILDGICDSQTIRGMLHNPQVRWALVTRVIIEYLMSEVLHATFMMGYDSETDRKIRNALSQMPQGSKCSQSQVTEDLADSPEDDALAAKEIILKDMTGLVSLISQKPDFPNFLNHQFERVSQHLIAVITPLMTAEAGTGPAHRDLENILRESIDVSMKMNTLAVEWIVEFPQPGDKFQASGMINRCATHTGHPYELERRNLRIELSVMPSIVRRVASGRAVDVKTAHNAHVILMP